MITLAPEPDVGGTVDVIVWNCLGPASLTFKVRYMVHEGRERAYYWTVTVAYTIGVDVRMVPVPLALRAEIVLTIVAPRFGPAS
jgi:hypothetical protein